MKKFFLEHYYTVSIHKGGVATLDNSKDLSKEEISELEKRVVYRQPDQLPRAPTEYEIEELFPVNISFFQLESSGRYVYLRSKYVGMDNLTRDRFGNFFSHSLILKDGEPDFKASAIFKKKEIFTESLSLSDDRNYRPKLDVLELEINHVIEADDFQRYAQFVFEHASGIAVFSKIIDEIIDGLIKISRIAVICDNKDNLTNWMLATNFFLPGSLSNSLSFASYVVNPRKATAKLTGITKECGVTSFDSNFVTYIDATTDFQYTTKHDFTKCLLELISDPSNFAFELLRLLNHDIEKLGLTEFDAQLNKPATYINFLRNIKRKTFRDYNSFISSDLPIEKQDELKSYILGNNPELFLEIIFDEFFTLTNKSSSFDEKRKVFLGIYDKYFKNNIDFKKDHLSTLIDWFKEVVAVSEKAQALTFALLNTEGSIFPLDWFNNSLQEIDNYFAGDDDFNEKLVPAKALFTKYNLSDYPPELTSNLTRLFVIEELNAISLISKFTELSDENYNLLFSLTGNIKVTIVIQALNNEFTKDFNGNFKNCIYYVKLLFAKNEERVWLTFFEKNNGYNIKGDPGSHPLSYVKAMFVRYLYLNQSEQLRFVKNLTLTNNEYGWICLEINAKAEEASTIGLFAKDFSKPGEKRELWSPHGTSQQ